MILRGLLCAVLLLAISGLAQAGPAPASPAPAGTDANLYGMRLECTPASQAAQLTGKHGCVAGKVFRVTTTKRGATHLSLCPSRGHGKCSFHVVTLARNSSSIGDLAYLRGKIIAVVGDVTEYRGHPRIVVRDREQIQVAADDAPQDFDASQPRFHFKGIPGGRHGRAW